jgi:hypothetical protein
MILSEEKKLIFLHIPRTGGTSIRSLFNIDPVLGCFSAKMMKQQLGDKYNDYRSFTVVRNPWDRAVSLYYFLTKKRPQPFATWITNTYGPLPLKDSWYIEHWLSDENGKLAVNDILRYENYEAEVSALLGNYGISGPLPHLNQTEGRTNYQSYYNAYTKDVIYQNHVKDIKQLGYEF